MQLRSKTLKEPPKRRYVSAYRLFFNNQKQNLKSIKGNSITKQISKMWKELNKQERNYYQTLFNEEETKFQQDLQLFYGENIQVSSGAKSDVKPKKPITACLAYVAKRRKEFKAENPLICTNSVTKILCEEYRSLPALEKEQYEVEFKELFKKYKQDVEVMKKQSQKKQVAKEKKPIKKTKNEIAKPTENKLNKRTIDCQDSEQISATIQSGKASPKIRIIVNSNSTSQIQDAKTNIKKIKTQVRSKSLRCLSKKTEIQRKPSIGELTDAFSNQSTFHQSAKNEPTTFVPQKRKNNKSKSALQKNQPQSTRHQLILNMLSYSSLRRIQNSNSQ